MYAVEIRLSVYKCQDEIFEETFFLTEIVNMNIDPRMQRFVIKASNQWRL